MFTDKTVIMLFMAAHILQNYEGTTAVILLFSMIAAAAFTSYLRMLGKRGERVNTILIALTGIGTLIRPEAAVLIPVLAYDAFFDRDIPAGVALAAGMAGYIMERGINSSLYILLISLLSIYISYNTSRLIRLETDIRRVRDEGEIRKEMLARQKQELLDEQDKNIYSAQLSERNRIAREIHDNVGHMLSRSILQVGALMVVHKNDGVGEELGDLRKTLDCAMNNIRESVHNIRDDSIDLRNAVEEIASPLKNDFRVMCEFDADEAGISKDVKYAVINIVKEAVSNIIKYSNNTCVDIRFYEHPSMYQLVVHDHTAGNDRNTPGGSQSGEGMGLENIRLRAQKLGGDAVFTNDNGFRVFVRIPKKGGDNSK